VVVIDGDDDVPPGVAGLRIRLAASQQRAREAKSALGRLRAAAESAARKNAMM
jgi:hypothetical protein